MYRLRLTLLLVVGCALPCTVGSVCRAQAPAAEPLTLPPIPSTSPATNPTTKSAEGLLRVRLRLEDESAFLGTADVRLMPNEGYEVSGTPTDTEGETVFSELAAGKYMVEVSAPGYSSVRLGTEIAAGQRQRIMYVMMKPRPMAGRAEKPKEEEAARSTPAAPAAVAGANAF